MSISRSIVRPLQKSVTRSVIQGAVTDPLQELIQQLFGNGEQGAFYLPQPVVNGQQALFQDAAGTIPVTANGDPVGLMKDLSGNDTFIGQSGAASKPILQEDLLGYDAVDDFLSTERSDVGGVSLLAEPLSEWTAAIVLDSPIGATGTLAARASETLSTRTFQMYMLGTNNVMTTYLRGEATSTSLQIAGVGKTLVWVSWDGTTARAGATGQTTQLLNVGAAADETSQDFVLGARSNGNGFFLNGSLGPVIIISRALSSEEITTIETALL